jgi:hypothetical protein
MRTDPDNRLSLDRAETSRGLKVLSEPGQATELRMLKGERDYRAGRVGEDTSRAGGRTEGRARSGEPIVSNRPARHAGDTAAVRSPERNA